MKNKKILKNWESTYISNIGTVITGTTPSTANQSFYGGPYKLISPADLDLGRYVRTAHRMLSKEGLDQCKILPKRSVLVGCIGNVGKIGMTIDEQSATNQQINAIICNDKSYAHFVFYSLLHYRETLQSKASKTAVPILKKSDFEKIKILLPHLAEQRAIANLLGTWDRAIEKTGQLIQAKEKQFKWLLKKLITDQQNNPTWQKVKLGDICEIFKGQGLSKSNISKTGKNKCILYGELYTVYPEIIKEVVSRTNVNNGVVSKVGDVLLPGSTTTKGIDLAKATTLLENGVLLGGDINILRAKNTIYDSAFLSYCLTHSKKREIAGFTQGITIIHLYGKDLKLLEISLPRVAQQKKISHILHTAQKEIDLLKKIMEKYHIQKKGLIQKLLTGKWRLKI